MANSSILGGARAPQRPSGTDNLGPSDSSDSGSDIQGQEPMATSPDNPGEWGAIPTDPDSDSDALGTGERAQAAGSAPLEAGDIRPDRIVEDPQGDLLDEEQQQIDELVEALAIDDDDGSAPTSDPEKVVSEDDADAITSDLEQRARRAAGR